MYPIAFAVLALSASPAAQAASAGGPVTRINAAPARDGWFVCDAISGHDAAFVGKPDARGRTLITLLDRRTGRFDTQSYQVGQGDPGAGQIHWSLSQKGREVGNVHGINLGMVVSGGGLGTSIAPIVGMTIGARTLDCRWLADMRFIGLDSRRGFVVTQGPEGLVYQSFDFKGRGPLLDLAEGQRSNRPTLRITGGVEQGGGFRFANRGYAYVVDRGGTVSVTRGGTPVQTERLVGYTFAPRIE